MPGLQVRELCVKGKEGSLRSISFLFFVPDPYFIACGSLSWCS